MRLLIVEDNRRLAELMAKRLAEERFVVDTVATAEAASAALKLGGYDLVLIDLSLPDGDGGEVLRELRGRGGESRVLVATARAEVAQRVAMLDQGADDYLVKPFSVEELLARVRALLRRPAATAPSSLAAGRLTLDTLSLTVRVGGEVVSMPRRELAVLFALLDKEGKLVARQKLENAVYSFDAEVGPNAIEAVVSRLRRRLDALEAGIGITAMRGLGYILAERLPC